MRFTKQKQSMKRLLVLIMAFVLVASLLPSKAIYAEQMNNTPQKAKCTMTIESDKHTLQNPARPTYPCTELEKGFYVKETGQFMIFGMATYPVEYSGQNFEIGIPYDGYTTAILTVYTVKKDVPKTGGKVATGGAKTPSKSQPATKPPSKPSAKPKPKPKPSTKPKQPTHQQPRQDNKKDEARNKEKNKQETSIKAADQTKGETKGATKPTAQNQKIKPQQSQKTLREYEDVQSLIEKYSQEEAALDVSEDLKRLVDYGFENEEIPSEELQGFKKDVKRWNKIKGFFELERIQEIKELQSVKSQLEKFDDQNQRRKREAKSEKAHDEPTGVVEKIKSFIQSITKFFKQLF